MYVFVARHAEDHGPSFMDEDRNLTLDGVKQAKELAKNLIDFNIQQIFHSPLTRAKITAEIVSLELTVKSQQWDTLKEQESGDKLEKDEPLERTNGFIEMTDRFRGGESYENLKSRSKNVIDLLKSSYDIDSEISILLVTHGRIMTCLFAELLNMEFNGFFLEIPFAHYYVFKIISSWRPQLDLSKMKYLDRI